MLNLHTTVEKREGVQQQAKPEDLPDQITTFNAFG